MDKVDGGDDGRRYFPLIFLLVISYFSLSFIFSSFFSSFFFNISEDWHKDMEEL